MISNKLKTITELQNITELDELNYKKHDFNKVPWSSIFLRDLYRNKLSIENADNEQSDLYEWFSNLKKGRKSLEKISFLKNVEILLRAKEDVLNSFKSNLLPIMSDITPRETSINEESFMN